MQAKLRGEGGGSGNQVKGQGSIAEGDRACAAAAGDAGEAGAAQAVAAGEFEGGGKEQ